MHNTHSADDQASGAFATFGDAIGSSVKELGFEPEHSESVPASDRRPTGTVSDNEMRAESEAPVPDIAKQRASPGARKRLRYQPSAAYKIAKDLVSTAKLPEGKVSRWLEGRAQSWGKKRLERLTARRGMLTQSMREIPEKMHRAAQQSELVLELIDDFRSGTYREVRWTSIALMAGALLYTVSPADVIPDTVPLIGVLDDVSIIALATRFVRKDLTRYCEFKGYKIESYFAVEE